ncbi:hypothetical protein COLO4_04434 [Corchorus olitorius]|uniref:Uncharacterized protein n=1 Tax=Corchorus olitorius TaxID=93759 RepID=A0A1R3KTY6_9ROSI|nr:hypothetical protein COLO4_04434 [Corchorus olitorius]
MAEPSNQVLIGWSTKFYREWRPPPLAGLKKRGACYRNLFFTSERSLTDGMDNAPRRWVCVEPLCWEHLLRREIQARLSRPNSKPERGRKQGMGY